MIPREVMKFPGGGGTEDGELAALALMQTCAAKPLPIMRIERAFWSGYVDFPFLGRGTRRVGLLARTFRQRPIVVGNPILVPCGDLNGPCPI